MKILTIIGARPQFVKAAVVSKALLEAGIEEEIIHTGQHYDKNMSEVFFTELGIPTPSRNLEAGSGSHGKQTAQMLDNIESLLLDHQPFPDYLMVYGDTNSTLAGALAASKLEVPIIHVEAGLRSFNRSMPEEINRVLTDHISDLLFCSSEKGVAQLKSEGITKGVHDVGDVMQDAVLTFLNVAESRLNTGEVVTEKHGSYVLLTIHRPSNTDNAQNLQAILDGIKMIDAPVIWPVHPRARKQLKNHLIPKNLYLHEPKSYFEMLLWIKYAHTVMTDSGGLQKEAYWQKKRCITVRTETEWVETLEGGWNRLTGPDSENIIRAWKQMPETEWIPLYGNGKASQKIAQIIKEAGTS